MPGRSLERSRTQAPCVYLVTPGGTDERGGISRLVTGVVRYWRDSGDGPAFRIVDTYGPWQLYSSPFYLLAALARIAWGAWRGRIRLLHIHMASRGSILRKGLIVWLGAALGLPILLHLHSGAFVAFAGGLPAPLGALLRATLRRADRVVVLGAQWRQAAHDKLGIDPRKAVILMNGVAGPAEPPARGEPEGPCRLLFLGKLRPEKGVDELLEALADPRLARLDWRACLAGDGTLAAYRARAEALGLAERIEFPGWLEAAAVEGLLRQSDVFVLPSHFEGLSIAMLEALAYGLASVVSRVGAADEVVEDGVSGLLIPAGDREALIGALEKVIGDPALRARLQRAGRQRFNENFDISVYCKKLAALYGEMDQQPTRV